MLQLHLCCLHMFGSGSWVLMRWRWSTSSHGFTSPPFTFALQRPWTVQRGWGVYNHWLGDNKESIKSSFTRLMAPTFELTNREEKLEVKKKVASGAEVVDIWAVELTFLVFHPSCQECGTRTSQTAEKVQRRFSCMCGWGVILGEEKKRMCV